MSGLERLGIWKKQVLQWLDDEVYILVKRREDEKVRGRTVWNSEYDCGCDCDCDCEYEYEHEYECEFWVWLGSLGFVVVRQRGSCGSGLWPMTTGCRWLPLADGSWLDASGEERTELDRSG